MRIFVFIHRLIEIWHILPEGGMEAGTLAALKQFLVEHLKHYGVESHGWSVEKIGLI